MRELSLLLERGREFPHCLCEGGSSLNACLREGVSLTVCVSDGVLTACVRKGVVLTACMREGVPSLLV